MGKNWLLTMSLLLASKSKSSSASPSYAYDLCFVAQHRRSVIANVSLFPKLFDKSVQTQEDFDASRERDNNLVDQDEGSTRLIE